MSMLSCADSSEEVREEGQKGMKRPEDKPDSPYPDFQDFMKYVSKRVSSMTAFLREREREREGERGREGGRGSEGGKGEGSFLCGKNYLLCIQATTRLQSNDCYSVAAGKMPFAPPSFIKLLQFLNDCLLISSGCGLISWEKFEHREVELLKQYVAVMHKEEMFQMFLSSSTMPLSLPPVT